MHVSDEVEDYLASQPERKQADLRELHGRIVAAHPEVRLWFSDGRDESGKVVANPSIGYGAYTITYADGSSREFYRIGLSATSSGISVYVLGLEDKAFLQRTYADRLGKASVTGYCIRFRSLSVVDATVVLEAVEHGLVLDAAP